MKKKKDKSEEDSDDTKQEKNDENNDTIFITQIPKELIKNHKNNKSLVNLIY